MKKIICMVIFLLTPSFASADFPTTWRYLMSETDAQHPDSSHCAVYAAMHCLEALYNYYYELGEDKLELDVDYIITHYHDNNADGVFEEINYFGALYYMLPFGVPPEAGDNSFPNFEHAYYASAGQEAYTSPASLNDILDRIDNHGPVCIRMDWGGSMTSMTALWDSTDVPIINPCGGSGYHWVVAVDHGIAAGGAYIEFLSSLPTNDNFFFKMYIDGDSQDPYDDIEYWFQRAAYTWLHDDEDKTCTYSHDDADEFVHFFAPKIYPNMIPELSNYDDDDDWIESMRFKQDDEELYILGDAVVNYDTTINDNNTRIINVYRGYTDGYTHNIIVFDDLELSDCIIRPFGTGDCDGVLRVSNGSLSLDDVLINDLDYGISIIGNSTVEAEYITIANADYGVYLAAGSSITIEESHIGTPNDGGNDISFNRLIQGGYGSGFTLSNNNITWNESYYAMINDYEYVDVSTNYWDTDDQGDIYDLFSSYGLIENWGSRAHAKIDSVGSSSTPKIAAPSPYEMARYYESIGDWGNAKQSYLQAISQSDDSMVNKRSLQYLLRIYEDQEWPADDLRIIALNEYDKALNKHKPTFDYLYNATYIAEGDYFTAIEKFENCAEKYAGTSVEVRMLSRIANIYGDYLDDPATAKEYADRAAAINPGQPILFSAYWSAGIRYEPEDYTDKFYRVLEYYDIPDDPDSEPVAGDEITASPNPFNPSTTIRYTLNQPSRVELSIYSLAGQKIETLVDTHQQAGSHAVTFDGGHLASGIYFYRFETAGVVKTGKLLMMK